VTRNRHFFLKKNLEKSLQIQNKALSLHQQIKTTAT